MRVTTTARPRRPSTPGARTNAGCPTCTFGMYRLEILAALANAVLLFGVAVYILFEAVQRSADPPAAHAHCVEAEGVTW